MCNRLGSGHQIDDSRPGSHSPNPGSRIEFTKPGLTKVPQNGRRVLPIYTMEKRAGVRSVGHYILGELAARLPLAPEHYYMPNPLFRNELVFVTKPSVKQIPKTHKQTIGIDRIVMGISSRAFYSATFTTLVLRELKPSSALFELPRLLQARPASRVCYVPPRTQSQLRLPTSILF